MQWLATAGSRLAADLVLALLVRVGLQLAAGAPVTDSPGLAELFGRLATEEHRAGRSDAPPTLADLRDLSGLSAESSPQLSLVDTTPLALLADLLRLPRNVEPLEWLRSQRAQLCARIALKTVVDAAFPAPSSIVQTPSARTTRLHTGCSAGRSLRVAVTALTEYATGFSIQLSAGFDIDGAAPGDPATRAIFEGFERVVDDAGSSYAVWPLEIAVTTSPWPWARRRRREVLRLVCAPELPPYRDRSIRLVLESPMAALTVERRTPGGESVAIATPVLGALRCEVRLPPV